MKYMCLFVALLAFLTSGCRQTSHIESRVTIIENITAIDVIYGVRENVDVVIVDQNIESVGVNAGPAFLAQHSSLNPVKIDGTNKFLIPGLWDAHVHLTYLEGTNHEVFFPLSIAHGVTSLRDLGGHLEALEGAIITAKTDKIAPSLYVSGPLLDGKNRVYDGSSSFYANLSVGLVTPEDAENYVDSLASLGVDFVKAYEMLEPDVFAALAQRAALHDLPVAAHIPLSTTLRKSVKYIDDMQHLRNLEFACVSNREALLEERRLLLAQYDGPSGGELRRQIHQLQRPKALAMQDEQSCKGAINILLENKVFQTPTASGSRFGIKPVFANSEFRKSFAWMPPEIAKVWEERSKRFMTPNPNADTIAFDMWMMDIIRQLDERGVPIMAGTDAPIGFQTPGISLHAELATLVEAGLSPLSAIGAATYTPAKFFNIEDRIGTISPEKTADLVILNADPLKDIRNITHVNAVFKNGYLIDRDMLDQLKNKPSQRPHE